MKKPEYRDAERCFEIRKRSKRGEHVTQEEHEFCQFMFKEYPDWYGTSERKVFEETLPFGSNAKWRGE